MFDSEVKYNSFSTRINQYILWDQTNDRGWHDFLEIDKICEKSGDERTKKHFHILKNDLKS